MVINTKINPPATAGASDLATNELIEDVQRHDVGRDLNPNVGRLKAQRAARRLNIDASRKLLKCKQLDRIVLAIDGALNHSEQRPGQNRRRVVETNIAHAKPDRKSTRL